MMFHSHQRARTNSRRCAVAFISSAAAAILALAPIAAASSSTDQPSPRATEAETKPKPTPSESPAKSPPPLPGLDELLGLPTDKKLNADAPAAPSADQLKLDRVLDASEVSEMFQQAVQEMGDAAKLLSESRATGLVTQRVQEEILRKLEKLIEEAEKQQSSSGSSSQQQQQQGQQQPGQQPQQPQNGANQGAQGDNRNERTPPGGQSAPPSGTIDSLAAAWGSLPARLRDALLQGAGDKYSSLYESLTEAYYRRLAEQNKDGAAAPATGRRDPR